MQSRSKEELPTALSDFSYSFQMYSLYDLKNLDILHTIETSIAVEKVVELRVPLTLRIDIDGDVHKFAERYPDLTPLFRTPIC
jgi:hypothetical protein